MLNVVIAALLIAATLTAYTVHTILSHKPRHARTNDLPSQSFIRSFAEPLPPLPATAVFTQPVFTVAQDVSQMLHDAVQAIVDDIDATLEVAQNWSQIDWAQEAEDSLLHTRHGVRIPTGREFDAAEAQNIAAKVDEAQPAKKVRVYDLARDCNVDSKFMRSVLDNHFGIATKSPSSTVTQQQAAGVIEFFATHADA